VQQGQVIEILLGRQDGAGSEFISVLQIASPSSNWQPSGYGCALMSLRPKATP
jgi:hypothetical protein